MVPEHDECRIWVCNGARIPCGGTHVSRTGQVPPMTIRRRSKGKGMERVQYSFAV